MSEVENVQSTEPKAGRGQFKCFQCRKIYAMKDGDWHVWNAMEVHLCRLCEKTTKSRPERSSSRK